MNHTVRARGIVGRAFPRVLFVKDGARTLRVNVEDWHQELTRAVAKGLRQCEREANNTAIYSAANYVGKLHGRGVAFEGLLGLVMKGRQGRG